MKKVMVFVFVLCANVGISQKPSLDIRAIQQWPSILGPAGLSNDGKYLFYTIKNKPVGDKTVILQDISKQWFTELVGIKNISFTEDSRNAVFIEGENKLCVVTLGGLEKKYIPNVNSFSLSKIGSIEWLVYHLSLPENDLVFLNLTNLEQRGFKKVGKYQLEKNGKSLLLNTTTGLDHVSIELVDFSDVRKFKVWDGSNASGFVFDSSGTQVAFIVDSTLSNGEKTKLLYYYKKGMISSIKLPYSLLDTSLTISNIYKGFSKDGTRIFVLLKEKRPLKLNFNAALVDVWNYRDTKLQSHQLKEIAQKEYLGVLDIKENRIFRLQFGDESIQLLSSGKTDDLSIVTNSKGHDEECNWNSSACPSWYIAFTRTGLRKKLPMEFVSLSPDEQYLICIDGKTQNYFSYEIRTDILRNITKQLPVPVVNREYDRPELKSDLEIAGWVKDGSAVLVYDKYDIWRIDPLGYNPPINVTNGSGRKNNIVLRLIGNYYNKTISEDEELVMSAFDKTSKQAGFFLTSLNNSKTNPSKLTMGPHTYNHYSLLKNIKARDSSIYLVQRSSCEESPNYFVTNDFASFKAVSKIYPERNYNWFTSELIVWKTLDGTLSKGILYKPQNFDSTKKYPLVFNYYEKRSDELNEFQKPLLFRDDINIPWFVTNGYIVFVPDIRFKIGEPGQSGYNSIISAARHFSVIPWIDSKKMGLHGHSFGGFQTNYIVTHSNLFAAAMSSSGLSNFVSGFGSILPGLGYSAQYLYEKAQLRIGAMLWDQPQLYLKNSPIFSANKVTTPLLMMSNKEDEVVPFSQGVEFFLALRRLKKQAWMLQYDGEGHGLADQKNQFDYTARISQFFDHYLKNAPAPVWMSRGIPARLKQIEAGYAYDPSGTCHKNCKVCIMWNEKWVKNSAGTIQEIERRKKEENWQ